LAGVRSESIWKLACPTTSQTDKAVGGHDLKTTLFSHGAVTPTESLEITAAQGDEGTTVRLYGRLNIESSPRLRDRLLALLQDQSAKTLVIDLTSVSYIDSSGVATLIEALKIARQRRIGLLLTGLEGRLLHLFEVTGMLALFKTTAAAATTSVSEVS
jgi:anti-sigma B factor antagonist